MNIETEKLKLREFEENDLDSLTKLLNNIKVSQNLLVFPYPFTKEDAQKSLFHMINRSKENPRTSYNLAIELKSTGKLIANMGLVKLDLNQGVGMVMYWLGEEYWKKGYGSEALKKILEFGFNELNLRRISAEVYPTNISSSKLLEKFGFKLEGHCRQSVICNADKKIKDTDLYALLKDEFSKIEK